MNVRMFFAVELPDGTKKAVARVAERLQDRRSSDGVRWVRPEAYHLTLRFLGEMAEERLAPLVREVASETRALEPFEARLGAPHALPGPRRPRVIALGVEPEEPLCTLAEAVERGVVRAGFPGESRRFRAHLSLGRVRGDHFPATAGVPAPETDPFRVGEVTLMKSDLRPTGAVYTPLERAAIGSPLLH